jgi:multidrug resistance efflux pump
MPAEYTIIDATPVPPKAAAPNAPNAPEIKPEPRTLPPDPEEDGEEAEAVAAPHRRRRWPAWIVFFLLVLAFAASILMERLTPYTSRATVDALVVRVAPEVAGRVIEVGVVDNAAVKAGDVLFRIDPQPFSIAVEQAAARLARAGQTIGVSTAALDAAQAKLVDAIAHRDDVRDAAQRTQSLVLRGALPQSEQESADAALKTAEAALVAAGAEIEKARGDLGSYAAADPSLREATAALLAARLALAHTTVAAPADGVVTDVALAVGEPFGAGQEAATFVDGRALWITADLGENSLEHVAPSDPVEIVLDALPGRVFAGHVESVGWGAAPESGEASALPGIGGGSDLAGQSRRFPLRITFDDGAPRGVRHGSHASVVIYTGNNPVANALGAGWIRLAAWLAYAK